MGMNSARMNRPGFRSYCFPCVAVANPVAESPATHTLGGLGAFRVEFGKDNAILRGYPLRVNGLSTSRVWVAGILTADLPPLSGVLSNSCTTHAFVLALPA